MEQPHSNLDNHPAIVDAPILLENWSILQDDTILAAVFRHPFHPDGKVILTSPLSDPVQAAPNAVVQTTSRISYHLGESHDEIPTVHGWQVVENRFGHAIGGYVTGHHIAVDGTFIITPALLEKPDRYAIPGALVRTTNGYLYRLGEHTPPKNSPVTESESTVLDCEVQRVRVYEDLKEQLVEIGSDAQTQLICHFFGGATNAGPNKHLCRERCGGEKNDRSAKRVRCFM